MASDYNLVITNTPRTIMSIFKHLRKDENLIIISAIANIIFVFKNMTKINNYKCYANELNKNVPFYEMRNDNNNYKWFSDENFVYIEKLRNDKLVIRIETRNNVRFHLKCDKDDNLMITYATETKMIVCIQIL